MPDAADALDTMPLELLLALQEAMADPSESGQARARMRARNVGIHIHCLGSPDDGAIALDEPPAGLEEAIVLSFEPAPASEA